MDSQNSASLLDMPSGCKLTVESLSGTPADRSKLYAMGILPGTEMEVCRQGCGKGSVCVRVRHSSLVLGEGMARSIFCRTAEIGNHHHHGHGVPCQCDDQPCGGHQHECGVFTKRRPVQ